MSVSDLTPGSTVTLTVSSAPRRAAERKTLERLMWMQPENRKTHKALQRQRATDNVEYVRAGRPWVNRKRATRPARAEVGTEFTIRVTPQIMPDLRSVSKYLTA